MPFSDTLAEKLAELRQAALDNFQEYQLRDLGGEVGELSEDGTQVINTSGTDERTIEGRQFRLDELLSALDVLEQRFNRYADLDTSELYQLRGSLCPGSATSLGLGDWGVNPGSPVSSPYPNYAVQRVDYAAHLVTEAADPHNAIWKGTAAEAFNENFLRQFEAAADQQVFCFVYLADVLQVFRNATEATAEDVLAIIEAGIRAFRREESDGIEGLLSIASLLATLVGFIPGAGTLAGGASVVLWGLSETASDPAPPKWRVSNWSSYPTTIVEGVHDLLTTLEDRLGQLDGELRSALDQDIDYFFDPSRTRLSDAGPDPEDQIDPPDHIDELVDADVEAIFRMGWNTLPMAADHYRKAVEKVWDCNPPSWVRSQIFPRCHARFQGARVALGTSLDVTEGQLVRAGDALVDIANEYEWQDAAAAGDFERLRDGMPQGRAWEIPGHIR